MSKSRNITVRQIAAQARDEEGSATIEAVLWMPILLFLFMLAANACLAFFAHSQMMRVLQDVNRSMSVGRIASASEAEQTVRDMLPDYADELTVETTVSNGIIETVASLPVSAVITFHSLDGWIGSTAITVRSYQYAEL